MNQCLVGDTFWETRDVKEGALIDYGSKTLTATSTISDALKAHGQTDYFKAAGPKLGAVLGGAPEIQYYDIVE